MSLASWKREFYKTPANKTSEKFALKHSLRKWMGLLSKNRKRHKVRLFLMYLSDETTGKTLPIDNRSCALCFYYYPSCNDCPLRNVGDSGYYDTPCGGAYDSLLCQSKPTPMINLLRRALKREMK